MTVFAWHDSQNAWLHSGQSGWIASAHGPSRQAQQYWEASVAGSMVSIMAGGDWPGFCGRGFSGEGRRPLLSSIGWFGNWPSVSCGSFPVLSGHVAPLGRLLSTETQASIFWFWAKCNPMWLKRSSQASSPRYFNGTSTLQKPHQN